MGHCSKMKIIVNCLLGEGNGTPLQYSCLENPMDGGTWWAAVLGVAKSRTQLSDFTFTFHFHTLEKEMATHSSVLAWRIPGTGEPGGLPSMGSHRVGHDWSGLAASSLLSPGGHHFYSCTVCSVVCCHLVTQSCAMLWDLMDCSLPGSWVYGILQARILKWTVVSFSRESSNQGVKLASPAWQVDSLPLSHQGSLFTQ